MRHLVSLDLRFSLAIYGSLTRFTLPKRFTRAQLEWRMDELALKFQRTHDRKLIARIENLSRALARMRERSANLPDYKKRR